MTFSLTWLPSVLEAAGLKVALVPGWAERGRAEMGDVRGVLCHHTAGPLKGNMPSLRTLIEGRGDLPGPLSQLGIGRDGTMYVIAAGRCNHAGAGEWQGLTQGNANFIGIEAENTGLPNDAAWPDVQLDAYKRSVAAILQHVGRATQFCAGHKEYALPRGRKSDPPFDMNAFRRDVTAIMAGTGTVRPQIPAAEPAPRPGAAVARPTTRRGDNNDWVKQIQTQCGLDADGHFGAATEAAVRELQRKHGAVPDGIVGPKSWAWLDAPP